MFGTVIFGILALLMIYCIMLSYRALKLAIDVIDAAADFMYRTKRLILVPIFFAILTCGVAACWLGALMCVVSLNDVTANPHIP